MNKLAIKAENISKQYRLGEVGTGTLSHDLNRFWYKIRGKEDPYLIIGELNDRSVKGISDYVWSLKDLNFEIEQGDSVGIIGRNGAGKSTLLKLLSKVTKPTTGSFKVNGRIASLLEVGTGFNPQMTGRENIYLNGAILGMRRSEITRKLDEIIEFSGVERYIDTPVKRYSSGMYVRLAFAVAAHLESEILIVDEVLAVGDADFQKKCLGKMGDVSKGEGRTVLFVSHNFGAVKALCNKGILLNNGKIETTGIIDDVISLYSKNYSEDSITDLSSIKNRSGNGSVLFKSFHIINGLGKKTNVILTGESIELVVELIVTTKVDKINLGFSFHNINDERLSILYSSYQNIFFDGKIGLKTITLKIDNFPFNDSKIYVKGRVEADYVEADWPKVPIGTFEISRGDYYNTGVIIENNDPFLVKGIWY